MTRFAITMRRYDMTFFVGISKLLTDYCCIEILGRGKMICESCCFNLGSCLPGDESCMIKVIRIVIILNVLPFSPLTEACHGVTSMWAYHKTFLKISEQVI